MDGFELHVPALRAWFGRRLRNPADVDDAVQDVWMRAQAHILGGGIENVAAYLYQTAQSVLTDKARKAAVRAEAFHEPLQESHHPIEAMTPDRVLLGKEAVARVAEKVRQMPERTRDVFMLNRFEHVSYSEIAKMMGISVSAVEKHIMKALRLLADEMR